MLKVHTQIKIKFLIVDGRCYSQAISPVNSFTIKRSFSIFKETFRRRIAPVKGNCLRFFYLVSLCQKIERNIIVEKL